MAAEIALIIRALILTWGGSELHSTYFIVEAGKNMNHTVTPMFNIGRITAVVLLVILLASAIYACSNNYSAATSSQKTSASETILPEGARQVEADNGRIVVVRALEDPENPYRDEYKPWDYWFFDHLLAEIPEYKLWSQLTDAEKAERIAKRKAGMGWSSMRYLLDGSGFVIPFEKGIRMHEEGVEDNTFLDLGHSGNWVIAEGEIDPEMHQAMWEASYKVSAEFYPEIPSWLAENPPFEAIFLPNGDVVTHGLLGDFKKEGEAASCCGGKGSVVARYDHDGNLIRTLKDSLWFYLYYDADLNPEPVGLPSTSRDGYTTFRDERTGSLLSVWDWDGTQLPTTEPAWRDPHPYIWLNASYLVNLYEASH